MPSWPLLFLIFLFLVRSSFAIRCQCTTEKGAVRCYNQWCEVHSFNGKVGACAVVQTAGSRHFACVRVQPDSKDSCKVDRKNGQLQVRCWCRSEDYCNLDLADRVEDGEIVDENIFADEDDKTTASLAEVLAAERDEFHIEQTYDVTLEDESSDVDVPDELPPPVYRRPPPPYVPPVATTSSTNVPKTTTTTLPPWKRVVPEPNSGFRRFSGDLPPLPPPGQPFPWDRKDIPVRPASRPTTTSTTTTTTTTSTTPRPTTTTTRRTTSSTTTTTTTRTTPTTTTTRRTTPTTTTTTTRPSTTTSSSTTTTTTPSTTTTTLRTTTTTPRTTTTTPSTTTIDLEEQEARAAASYRYQLVRHRPSVSNESSNEKTSSTSTTTTERTTTNRWAPWRPKHNDSLSSAIVFPPEDSTTRRPRPTPFTTTTTASSVRSISSEKKKLYKEVVNKESPDSIPHSLFTCSLIFLATFLIF